jgi:hypothetical protein
MKRVGSGIPMVLCAAALWLAALSPGACGGDSGGASGTGGATASGGAGGQAGASATGGAAGSSMLPNVGPGGWDCAGTSGGGSDCGCTHNAGTPVKDTGSCPAKFTCCELLKISAGVSWYCNCYVKDDAACDADVASKDMLSGGNAAWRVPACPLK